MTTSYVHGGGQRPLTADTIGGALDRPAATWGGRPALVSCHQNRSYSYAELRQAANEVARALMALGVERGDRVGIWSANHAEWMITQYAAANAGAILVNLNPAYRARRLRPHLEGARVQGQSQRRPRRNVSPAGRRVVWRVAVAWLDYQLKGSAEAAKWFVGADCRLCTDPLWAVERKGMR